MSSGKCPGCLKPGSFRMLEVKATLEVTSQLPYYVDKESRPRKVEGEWKSLSMTQSKQMFWFFSPSHLCLLFYCWSPLTGM